LTVFPQNECEKCSINAILKLNEAIRNPSENEINCFLKSFDENCKNNVEYSEWSKEVLYDLLENYPERLTTALNTENQFNETVILNAISSPLIDENYDLIIERLLLLDKSDKRELILLSVEIAKSFLFNSIPENANMNFIGNWKANITNGQFIVKLNIKNGLIKGYYCGYPDNLSKIDCGASEEAKDCPIKGILIRNQAEVLFTSCYSNETGKAIIEFVGDRLFWKTIIQPEGWFFAPENAELLRIE